MKPTYLKCQNEKEQDIQGEKVFPVKRSKCLETFMKESQ